MDSKYNIVLASNSPRRKELLSGLDLSFTVKVIDGIDESYPSDLPSADVALYVSRKKADAYREAMTKDMLVITADTVVVLDGEVLGKPSDKSDACAMLRKLSGKTHQVITGVCLTTSDKQSAFSVVTEVTFKELTEEEINHYVDTYKPFDKAGAYGIQEWIGYIGVTSLTGSYFNVMGLPIQRIYNELRNF